MGAGFTNLGRPYAQLIRFRKNEFGSFIALCILTAFMESYSVHITVPFLSGLLAANNHIQSQATIKPLIEQGDQISVQYFILIMISSSLLRIFATWAAYSLSSVITSDLSTNVFKNIVGQNYGLFRKKAKHEYTHLLTHEIECASASASMLFQLISSSLIGIFLILELIRIDTYSALISFGSIFTVYLIISTITHTWKKGLSIGLSSSYKSRASVVEWAIADIKHVILHNQSKNLIRKFAKFESSYRKQRGNSQFFATAPKFAVEGLGIGIVALLMSYKNNEIYGIVPVLGSILIASQKLLPTIQQSYYSLSELMHNYQSLCMLDEYILQIDAGVHAHLTKTTAQKMHYVNEFESVELSSVVLSTNSEDIKSEFEINFKMLKGEKILITGHSGAGKTTMMDALMGLSCPRLGFLKINGQIMDSSNISRDGLITVEYWHSIIAHVPQDVCITERSIVKNILDDLNSDVDWQYFKEVCIISGVADLVEQNNIDINTVIKSNNRALSGGEKQMIGIARALYRRPTVLFLDESTAWIDSYNEIMILERLLKSEIVSTICMISHNSAIRKLFDKVYNLDTRTFC